MCVLYWVSGAWHGHVSDRCQDVSFEYRGFRRYDRGVVRVRGMDPFEEMLARFFGARAHRRPQERISIARLMSE